MGKHSQPGDNTLIALIQILPDMGETSSVRVDASFRGIMGALLTQDIRNDLANTAYCSELCNK